MLMDAVISGKNDTSSKLYDVNSDRSKYLSAHSDIVTDPQFESV